jgi:hypothetical protein
MCTNTCSPPAAGVMKPKPRSSFQFVICPLCRTVVIFAISGNCIALLYADPHDLTRFDFGKCFQHIRHQSLKINQSIAGSAQYDHSNIKVDNWLLK